jgi:hypothetical protein
MELDEISVPEGTLIHIGGIPFRLKEDTVLLGKQANYNLAMDIVNDMLPRVPPNFDARQPGKIGAVTE